MRINSIQPQFAPLAWAVFCVFGLIASVRRLFEYDYLSPPWQVGIGGIVLVVVGFLLIEGWWFASQREFTVNGDRLRVRRWLDALFGRPGIVIDFGDITGAALVYDGSKKLEFQTPTGRVQFWAGIWDRRALHALMVLLSDRGIPTRAEWGPDSPEDEGG